MQKLYRNFIKRILDIVCSLLALIILSPVLIIIALLVRVKLGSPVIFKQARPGKDEKIFNLYKFRTMTDERSEDGELLPDSHRLTNFGKTLRSTSLDELPSLINIIKGDMSFIGPRPLLIRYLTYYTKSERIRHTVRPGLTGLAQINGRNTLNWEERFKYDLYYVENLSFKLDLHIFINTIQKVFVSEDIVTRGTGDVIDFDKYRSNQMEQRRDIKGNDK